MRLEVLATARVIEWQGSEWGHAPFPGRLQPRGSIGAL